MNALRYQGLDLPVFDAERVVWPLTRTPVEHADSTFVRLAYVYGPGNMLFADILRTADEHLAFIRENTTAGVVPYTWGLVKADEVTERARRDFETTSTSEHTPPKGYLLGAEVRKIIPTQPRIFEPGELTRVMKPYITRVAGGLALYDLTECRFNQFVRGYPAPEPLHEQSPPSPKIYVVDIEPRFVSYPNTGGEFTSS